MVSLKQQSETEMGRQQQLRERPQYHYFYGSTDDGAEPPATPAASSMQSPQNVSTSTDLDSLVGESLLPTTDAETYDESGADTPMKTLLSNGNGVHLLVDDNGDRRDRKRGGSFFRCCHCLSLHRLREHHPFVHVTMLAFAVALFLFIFTVVVFPGSRAAQVVVTPENEVAFIMPFEKVDRADYGDGVDKFLVKELFDPSLYADESTKKKGDHREFVFPFPSGAFWINLVLPPTADRGLSYPIAVYPYAFKWSPDMIQASYPSRHRREDPVSVHDDFFPDLTVGTVEAAMERHLRQFDPLSVTLRYTLSQKAYWETYLVQGSPYLTIKYQDATPLIQPMFTFVNVLCPRDSDNLAGPLDEDNRRRRRLSYGVCSSEDDEDGKTTTLHGVQFVLQTSDGMDWMVFASEPIALIFDRKRKRKLFGADTFKGVLRFALIPSSGPKKDRSVPSSDNGVSMSSPGVQRLIYHAGVYPTGGDVSWSFRNSDSGSVKNLLEKAATSVMPTTQTTKKSTSSRIGTVQFEFRTSSFDASNSASTPKPLLMLALPHHASAMSSTSLLSSSKFELVYRCIKGTMRPILGSTWSYDETLPTFGFDGGAGSSSDEKYLDPAVRSTILESLKEDVKLVHPTLDENVYGFGKQTARIAQLAHIAKKLETGNDCSDNSTKHSKCAGDSEDEELSGIVKESRAVLSKALESLFSNNVTDRLLYDSNLGGIVTSDGLADSHGDFGNGRYNDHHFHYGYLLYASAILGNLDRSFVEKFGNEVDALYYDVAHNSNLHSGDDDGVFFPAARHKVWFDGHSYASGFFHFGDGKSQESSSEAVNCYYGAYLWSLVRHESASDPESDVSSRTDFARLLLAMEIRGARTYWHMEPPANTTRSNSTGSDLISVYSPQFSKNYMVGNVGMLDALCTTWFGTEPLYVHLINFLPVTTITGNLFGEEYVAVEYKEVLEHLEAEMAWRGYLVADHAIVDPRSAWREALELVSRELDAGVSKSQILYWISTRHGFDAKDAASQSKSDGKDSTSQSSAEPKSQSSSSNQTASDSGSCAIHKLCAEAGLTGDCCPTGKGTYLDCCGGS